MIGPAAWEQGEACETGKGQGRRKGGGGGGYRGGEGDEVAGRAEGSERGLVAAAAAGIEWLWAKASGESFAAIQTLVQALVTKFVPTRVCGPACAERVMRWLQWWWW